MIKPHGGVLINRILSNENEKKEILEQERYLPKLWK